MSDESDRMDRARRIRQLREGGRPTGNGSGQSGGSVDDDDAAADEDAAADTDAAVDDDGEATTEDEGPDDDPVETTEESAPDDDPNGGRDDPGEDTSDVGSLRLPGVDVGDVDVDPAALAREAGLDADALTTRDERPDRDGSADSAATGETHVRPGAELVAAAGTAETARAERPRSNPSVAGTRVLEFELGGERYCLDIEHVDEIVRGETVTRVPNTPEFVAGVVDLRGQITTVVDPRVLFEVDAGGGEDLLVVFDPDGFDDLGAIGWLVDDVDQVTPVADEEVTDSPVDGDHVRGVVERDGEFVVWTSPELALDESTC